MESTDACANCGLPSISNPQKHCHGCGQAVPVSRIDWAFMRKELSQSVLQIERGTLFTLKALFTRPGHFLREYLQGKRAGHVKPLPLLMLSAAATLIVAKFTLQGVLIDADLSEQAHATLGDATRQQSLAIATLTAKFNQAQAWANENLTLTTLIMLPFEAAAFKMAFGRRAKLNYPEWLVVTSYLTVQTFVVWSFILVFQMAWPTAKHLLLPASLAIALLTLLQLFNTIPKWNISLRTMLGFLMLEVFIAGATLGAAVVLSLLYR